MFSVAPVAPRLWWHDIYVTNNSYTIYIEIHPYIEQIRFLTNDIMSHPAINVLSFSKKMIWSKNH